MQWVREYFLTRTELVTAISYSRCRAENTPAWYSHVDVHVHSQLCSVVWASVCTRMFVHICMCVHLTVHFHEHVYVENCVCVYVCKACPHVCPCVIHRASSWPVQLQSQSELSRKQPSHADETCIPILSSPPVFHTCLICDRRKKT